MCGIMLYLSFCGPPYLLSDLIRSVSLPISFPWSYLNFPFTVYIIVTVSLFFTDEPSKVQWPCLLSYILFLPGVNDISFYICLTFYVFMTNHFFPSMASQYSFPEGEPQVVFQHQAVIWADSPPGSLTPSVLGSPFTIILAPFLFSVGPLSCIPFVPLSWLFSHFSGAHF